MAQGEADQRTPKAIGDRLRLTREALGLRSSEFADRAGIPRNQYTQFERPPADRRGITIPEALKLVDEYGLTLDWIYLGKTSGLPHDLRMQMIRLSERNQTQDV